MTGSLPDRVDSEWVDEDSAGGRGGDRILQSDFPFTWVLSHHSQSVGNRLLAMGGKSTMISIL